MRRPVPAADLTPRFAKAQILEWYLNTADYGNQAYGIDAAALTYFGKHAGELSLAEATLLAGIPLHPSTNPTEAPAEAEALQGEVLSALARDGFITPERLERARTEPTGVLAAQAAAPGNGSDYGRYAWEGLERAWGSEFSRWGGLSIRTAEDHDLQLQAACVAGGDTRRRRGPPLPPDGEALPAGTYRGPVRMRSALAAGLETAAQRTFALAGIENVSLIAREMGLDLPVDLT